MRVVKNSIIATAICLVLILQTGCWSQNPYERIGFILQMGLELDKDDKLLISMTSPVVAPEVKDKVEFLHTSSESLIRASREKLSNIAGKRLQGGKIQQLYFSKSLAKKGINQFLEIFLREPENPLLANVVIVDDSPEQMMKFSIDYKDKPRSAFYVNELLADARRRCKAPETRIYDFSVQNYSKTIDPVAPLLRYNKENIEVAGSALFSGDKLVGEIDPDQTMLLIALLGKKFLGEYVFRGKTLYGASEEHKIGATMLLEHSKRKIEIDTRNNTPAISIKLELKSILEEYAGTESLSETEYEKKLEEDISNSIKTDILKLLEYLKAIGSDPIGFGEIVRSKHNIFWKSVKWKEVYKNAIFNVDVKMTFESYGTIK